MLPIAIMLLPTGCRHVASSGGSMSISPSLAPTKLAQRRLRMAGTLKRRRRDQGRGYGCWGTAAATTVSTHREASALAALAGRHEDGRAVLKRQRVSLPVGERLTQSQATKVAEVSARA